MNPAFELGRLQMELEALLTGAHRAEHSRQLLSIARGWLELARDHGAPLNVGAIVSKMVDVIEIGWPGAASRDRTERLYRLRVIAGYADLVQPQPPDENAEHAPPSTQQASE